MQNPPLELRPRRRPSGQISSRTDPPLPGHDSAKADSDAGPQWQGLGPGSPKQSKAKSCRDTRPLLAWPHPMARRRHARAPAAPVYCMAAARSPPPGQPSRLDGLSLGLGPPGPTSHGTIRPRPLWIPSTNFVILSRQQIPYPAAVRTLPPSLLGGAEEVLRGGRGADDAIFQATRWSICARQIGQFLPPGVRTAPPCPPHIPAVPLRSTPGPGSASSPAALGAGCRCPECLPLPRTLLALLSERGGKAHSTQEGRALGPVTGCGPLPFVPNLTPPSNFLSTPQWSGRQ